MECFECLQVRVNKVFGYGIYSPEILFYCDRIGASGEIHWQPYEHGPEDYVFSNHDRKARISGGTSDLGCHGSVGAACGGVVEWD